MFWKAVYTKLWDKVIHCKPFAYLQTDVMSTHIRPVAWSRNAEMTNKILVGHA